MCLTRYITLTNGVAEDVRLQDAASEYVAGRGVVRDCLRVILAWTGSWMHPRLPTGPKRWVAISQSAGYRQLPRRMPVQCLSPLKELRSFRCRAYRTKDSVPGYRSHNTRALPH
jgi:hypothetical protein